MSSYELNLIVIEPINIYTSNGIRQE